MACKITTWIDLPWHEAAKGWAKDLGGEVAFYPKQNWDWPNPLLQCVEVRLTRHSGAKETHVVNFLTVEEFCDKMRTLTQLRLVPK